MKDEMTIALLGRGFYWAGGIDFLRHLANGLLSKQKTHKFKIYLLLPIDNKIETPFDILRVAMRSIKSTIQQKRPCFAVPTPAFQVNILDFFLHTQEGQIDVVYHENSSSGLLRCLKKINADVALPVNGTLGSDYPVPWVGYAYDFQHKHLSENFNSQECFNRDIHFATIFRDATAAVVNSRAVKNDVFRIFPYTKTKVYSLPFSPNPVPEWFEELPSEVLAKYTLPEKYFLISNQFWIHKDHLTAFKALTTTDSHIVCTGAMADYRRPDYLSEIKDFLTKNGLEERVKLLGHIPKRHQIEIMKKSVAVVQPTLFEGGPGGGCVYDAVALGVPAIISDIPVNKEVESGNIYFFSAGNYEDLSEKMRELLRAELNRPGKDQLIMMGQSNLEKLGDCLLEAVSCVVL